MSEEIRYMLPHIGELVPSNKEVLVSISHQWSDDLDDVDRYCESVSFRAEEAMELGIRLCKAAIKLLTEAELESLKRVIQ